MKKLLIALPFVFLLAGCETPAQTIGGGALLGAAVDSGDRVRGAALGAAAGVATAVVLQQLGNNRCVYRDRVTGETWRAACP